MRARAPQAQGPNWDFGEYRGYIAIIGGTPQNAIHGVRNRGKGIADHELNHLSHFAFVEHVSFGQYEYIQDENISLFR
ncbi:hypothetical protein VNO77_34336 [Canavalia gladiata]|uniref:Uncharacterized protein n=1 Tax=Canavalia gladiata TaxID=3824 RepID=A0AAN9KGD3_CANGL